MTIVKRKPTSPGRRFVVSVVNADLHKGAPHAPLLEKRVNQAAVTMRAVSPLAMLAVAISNTIE